MTETGKLYVVGTPIGNLSDFSPRGIETLESVDYIAAEDTRVTLRLLTHFGIKKPLLSYYKPHEAEKSAKILELLHGGNSVALVSDAGMPCISDPGYTSFSAAMSRASRWSPSRAATQRSPPLRYPE